MTDTIERPVVLHVEDDPDILNIAGIALGMLGGYDLKQFPSGVEAVRAAPETDADLLLLDMMMPGLNGLETLACLRATGRFCDTPAILCTAKTVDLPEPEEALALGIIGTVRKPFDVTELPGQIQHMWNTHVATRREIGNAA